MFETLQPVPPDAILKLIDLYKADSNPQKADLGVGVYQDDSGNTPVMTAIKKAEGVRNREETSKSYFGPAGDPEFDCCITEFILGGKSPLITDRRIRSLQTPGGSGALRVAAELLYRTGKDRTLWVSTPTWANHVPLLSTAGLDLQQYPYYDNRQHVIDFDAMLGCLEKSTRSGDILLLHGSCHNPTGADPDAAQWFELTTLCLERGLIPFIDVAYHGFAGDIEQDLQAARRMLEAVPEGLLAYSCSKNFGLYRDRTGVLFILGADSTAADTAFSNAYNIVRTMYSVPPHHGAALVSIILGDTGLRQEWLAELTVMRNRIVANRQLLCEALAERIPNRDFSFLQHQNGMFSLLGVESSEVNILINDHSIYLPENGRINLAGVKQGNVDYITAALARVIR